MASRGRGRRGHPRGASQAPPIFDKQAFVEAVGIAAATNHRLVQQVAREVRVTSRGLRPSSSDIHRGRRSDGGRPLVHAG